MIDKQDLFESTYFFFQNHKKLQLQFSFNKPNGFREEIIIIISHIHAQSPYKRP